MARLLIISGAAQAQAIELKPGVIRLGRSLENDYFLNDLTVSDKHCEIVFQNDSVLVRDLDSTNGTWIDGQPIIESELHHGQSLHLGHVELVLETVPPTVAIPPLPVQQIVSHHVLPDGYPSCIYHPTRHATLHCTHCNKLFCNACVHKLRRLGGKTVICCPACSSQCVLSAWSVDMKRKKKSFLGTFFGNVKDRFKRLQGE
ncbi:MAG: FHA domain-containing protein [Verrucomicrobia bacterium]|nr:FHA domain-containing protein [Verrucomicrobiota bacterium]